MTDFLFRGAVLGLLSGGLAACGRVTVRGTSVSGLSSGLAATCSRIGSTRKGVMRITSSVSFGTRNVASRRAARCARRSRSSDMSEPAMNSNPTIPTLTEAHPIPPFGISALALPDAPHPLNSVPERASSM